MTRPMTSRPKQSKVLRDVVRHRQQRTHTDIQQRPELPAVYIPQRLTASSLPRFRAASSDETAFSFPCQFGIIPLALQNSTVGFQTMCEHDSLAKMKLEKPQISHSGKIIASTNRRPGLRRAKLHCRGRIQAIQPPLLTPRRHTEPSTSVQPQDCISALPDQARLIASDLRAVGIHASRAITPVPPFETPHPGASGP